MFGQLLAALETFAKTAIGDFLFLGTIEDATLRFHAGMCASFAFLAVFVAIEMQFASRAVDAAECDLHVFLPMLGPYPRGNRRLLCVCVF